MDTRIVTVLGVAAAVTALLATLLVGIKLAHREILRWRGVRTAHYISAVGEMATRGVVPLDPPAAWADDPCFHEVLSDYRLLLTGADRQFIDTLVERLGIVDTLVSRSKRRFPAAPRLRAISTVVNLADERHRDDLRSLLGDRNPHVRAHAVRGLARLGDADAVQDILVLATRVKAWEAARMVDALAAMGTRAVDPIRQWVETESGRHDAAVEVVALAVRTLGLIADPSAEPTLLELLASPRPEWRVAAASALEHTATDDALAPLVGALSDEDWRVRARAVVSLGAMAEPSVVEAVAALLRDDVWWIRQNAAAALGSIPGGRDALLVALDDEDPFAADAALNQLTVSGAIAEAATRVENGGGTETDRRLLARTSA